MEDPGEKEIGNLFYPFTPYSLDRIFIGISFPLFSNNWGAAFLRHLLGLIKPNGAVILPVYPEVQARDQGLWCRSSLENIFRSRSRYIGISNIWAENDGVMSMRVGRHWPPVIPSTARWLFEQAPRRAMALGLEGNTEEVQEFWQSETQRFWRLGCYHAVVEQIILNGYGPAPAGAPGDHRRRCRPSCSRMPHQPLCPDNPGQHLWWYRISRCPASPRSNLLNQGSRPAGMPGTGRCRKSLRCAVRHLTSRRGPGTRFAPACRRRDSYPDTRMR